MSDAHGPPSGMDTTSGPSEAEVTVVDVKGALATVALRFTGPFGSGPYHFSPLAANYLAMALNEAALFSLARPEARPVLRVATVAAGPAAGLPGGCNCQRCRRRRADDREGPL